MSDMLKHLIVGDLLGQLFSYFDRYWLNNSFLAFAVGFSSHIVLDYTDNEFVVNWFNIQELSYAIPFLLFQIIFSAILLRKVINNSRLSVSKYSRLRIYFIIGAVAPDIVDGIYSLINPAAWYNGQLLFPWHMAREGAGNVMSMYNTIIFSFAFVIVHYFLVLRNRDKKLLRRGAIKPK
ncbi:MAG: hypothetical protein ACOC2J_01985 [bacterium]